jgi:hypothetical protein
MREAGAERGTPFLKRRSFSRHNKVTLAGTQVRFLLQKHSFSGVFRSPKGSIQVLCYSFHASASSGGDLGNARLPRPNCPCTSYEVVVLLVAAHTIIFSNYTTVGNRQSLTYNDFHSYTLDIKSLVFPANSGGHHIRFLQVHFTLKHFTMDLCYSTETKHTQTFNTGHRHIYFP